MSVKEKIAGQVARGIVLPQRAMPPIIALHENAAAHVERSPFVPGAQVLESLENDAREAFLRDAYAALREHVAPALGELASYLAGPYSQAASSGFGQSAYPGGEQYYRYLVRAHTTLDLEPQEIHARGIQAVTELSEAMAQMRSHLRSPAPHKISTRCFGTTRVSFPALRTKSENG
jgi:uncharacterized protein (DUF885 family)